MKRFIKQPTKSNGAVLLNANLLEAMRAASEADDDANIQAVHAALLISELIVPIRDGANGSPEIRAWPSESGQPAMFTFTDIEALKAWAAGRPMRYATMKGVDLIHAAVEHNAEGLIINQAGPYGGGLSSVELNALAQLSSR